MGLEIAKNEDFVRKIDVARDKARYDEHVRSLLANKAILSRILKETVWEVKDHTAEQIEEMIEGTPQIHCVPVDPGLTNAAEAITGLTTEDVVPREGTVKYDILTFIMALGQSRLMKILINVEAQKDYRPGYDLVTRAVYYGARRISAQKGTEFTGSNYDDIKKVYSIWLCFDANVEDRNTVTEYHIDKRNLFGRFTGQERYDLMTCVFVRIGGDLGQYTEKNIQRLLMVLFSGQEDVRTIKKTLQDEYAIATSDAFDAEVNEMCNLSDMIFEKAEAEGMAQGIEKGMAQGIEKGMAQGEVRGGNLRAQKIAKSMKDDGIPTEIIIKHTELTAEEIERL